MDLLQDSSRGITSPCGKTCLSRGYCPHTLTIQELKRLPHHLTESGPIERLPFPGNIQQNLVFMFPVSSVEQIGELFRHLSYLLYHHTVYRGLNGPCALCIGPLLHPPFSWIYLVYLVFTKVLLKRLPTVASHRTRIALELLPLVGEVTLVRFRMTCRTQQIGREDGVHTSSRYEMRDETLNHSKNVLGH